VSVHGTAVVAAIGIGHTIAYTLGALVLGAVIRRRLGHAIFPRALLPTTAVAGAYALAAWLLYRELEPLKRVGSLVFVLVVGALAGTAYLVIWRRTRRRMKELRAERGPEIEADEDVELEDPDVALDP
jgi:hypothetical protein